MTGFKTPILLIIFNRPDVTETVFERIAQIKPLKLYVAADGPRNENLKDADLCEKTRSIIEKVNWPCEVKKLYRHQNLGCGKAVSEGITWFFEQEEQGIIIEDDILADASFFNFCETLLNAYKNDESIMAINGCNFQQGVKRGDGSFYFSAFPHVWGWATWRRAWQRYDFNLSDLNYFNNLNKLSHYFNHKKSIEYWQLIFHKMNRKMIDTWDYQWNYAIWNNKAKVITPNQNLISNIGFGEQATHTLNADSKFANLAVEPIHDIKHPSVKHIDKAADLFTIDYCY